MPNRTGNRFTSWRSSPSSSPSRSAALSLAGVGLLFAESQKTDGFYEAAPMNMHTTAFALRDDEFEAQGGFVAWVYGELKLQVEGVQKPVFVGIARIGGRRGAPARQRTRSSARRRLRELNTCRFRTTAGTTVPARPADRAVLGRHRRGQGRAVADLDVEEQAMDDRRHECRRLVERGRQCRRRL